MVLTEVRVRSRRTTEHSVAANSNNTIATNLSFTRFLQIEIVHNYWLRRDRPVIYIGYVNGDAGRDECIALDH